MRNLALVLSLVLLSRCHAAAPATRPAAVLTTTAQVQALRPEQAKQSLSVHLQGVITFNDPNEGYIFLKDQTGCIFLEPQRFYPDFRRMFPVVPGSVVDVTGITATHDNTQFVQVDQIREIARGHLPKAVSLNYARAADPAENSAWVTLKGVVRSATYQRQANSRQLVLELRVDDHIVYAPITNPVGLFPTLLIDTTVAVTGNVGTFQNRHSEVVGLSLNVPGPQYLRVLRPAAAPLSIVPLVPLRRLALDSNSIAASRRIRTRGAVALYYPGVQMVLKDGEYAMTVKTVAMDPLSVGREVEVTGFPVFTGNEIELQSSQVVSLGPAVDVNPREVSPAEALKRDSSGDLIAINGELVSATHGPSYDNLFLRSGDWLFQAVYNKSQLGATAVPEYEPGTRLRITGICVTRLTGYLSNEDSFQVLLRSPADIRMLAPPSWWTVDHILVLGAIVLLAAVLALGWGLVLRQRAVRHLAHLTEHDSLTGLPNRLLLLKRLELEVEHAARRGSRLAVFFLDLDRFKQINDSLGHAAGDEVLREIARRLVAAVRRLDIVARLSGDEFVVVLPGIGLPEEAAALAEKLLAQVRAPYRYASSTVTPVFSLGISLYPRDGTTGKSLLRLADNALRSAKSLGRNCYRFSSPEDDRLLTERMTLETSLREALVLNQFLLVYQPKYDASTGELRGAEALVRWRQPNGDLVPPVRFIPLAEETRLILPLGAFVLRQACRQAQSWIQRGLPSITISVNIAAAQFADPAFASQVAAALEETGLPPEVLELEITETTLMVDADLTYETLHQLTSLGVTISIDDFGTGYSSLSYLKRFPIDVIKIDQSFVRDIGSDPADFAIVSAIIGMGRGLGLEVIAEGVETSEQAGILRNMGCNLLQGYFFNRPMHVSDFEDTLRQASGIPA